MLVFKLKTNRVGMMLTEALVAVATLATAAIVLGSIITSGIDTTKTSKDYLVAQNLLIEGVEMVKIIRDSNRMIKPDKPDCWLYIKPANLIDAPNPDCAVNAAQAESNYIVSAQNNNWELQNSGTGDLAMENNQGGNEKYRLHKDNIGQLVHDTNLINPGKFYRSIKLVNKDGDQADFEVKLQWKDGAKTKTLLQKVTISNYI